ncbi:uncharacterized protein LOC112569275 isoform X2 [Pomacea canaliculata]|uniref:uncharacterized protein LOC112569275 isoform X2 n=1 Tax=Pomacea canaliculata TaxID=400727 RepID=UPI000D73E43B|nr:uncharacterized protein LOC112569275 isoform X2 [Pomacea canaliculata]XP_025102806.1 uncharacterized protein LOC112569275 isoform X2 [Pomacea canaliculata]
MLILPSHLTTLSILLIFAKDPALDCDWIDTLSCNTDRGYNYTDFHNGTVQVQINTTLNCMRNGRFEFSVYSTSPVNCSMKQETFDARNSQACLNEIKDNDGNNCNSTTPPSGFLYTSVVTDRESVSPTPENNGNNSNQQTAIIVSVLVVLVVPVVLGVVLTLVILWKKKLLCWKQQQEDATEEEKANL